jgi:glycosyltransferase involved in cell wall biosynthesis
MTSFSKPRLAIITTWFPPKSSSATNRMKAFAEYMAEDFEVVVFTEGKIRESKKWSERVQVEYIPDGNILNKIEDKTSDSKLVHYLKTGLRIILLNVIKSPMQKWVSKVTEEFNKINKDSSFKVIISSYSPKEPHEIALGIKKEHSNLFWVADMRDEMRHNPHIQPVERELLKSLELEMADYVDLYTSVSQPITQALANDYPNVDSLEIRNGFNFEIENVKIKEFDNNKIHLGYFGTFYGKRKPNFFFEAITAYMEKHNDCPFEIHLVGTHKNFTFPNQLAKHIHFIDQMSYESAVAYMAGMDANLLLEPTHSRKGVFTGKIFEYLGCLKPIFAAVDLDDVAAELVKDFCVGYVCDFEDVQAMVDNLEGLKHDWINKNLPKANENDRLSQHRKVVVAKLSAEIKTRMVSE